MRFGATTALDGVDQVAFDGGQVLPLDAAVDAGLLGGEDRSKLRESWILASRIRSAIKLWSGRASDTLPVHRNDLEAIAGILGMEPGHTTALEEQWFAASWRARAVCEREFFGYSEELRFPI